MNNFTHILDIKLYDKNNKKLIINDKLLNLIKNELKDKNTTHSIDNLKVSLKWVENKWKEPYNEFIGDLVTNSPCDLDIITNDHLKISLLEIQNKILKDNEEFGTDWKIVYNLSKPIITNMNTNLNTNITNNVNLVSLNIK